MWHDYTKEKPKEMGLYAVAFVETIQEDFFTKKSNQIEVGTFNGICFITKENYSLMKEPDYWGDLDLEDLYRLERM